MIAPSPDLPQAFAKARQHFLEAGRDDLAAWAALELAGYPPASPVPAYRTVPAQARGKLGNNDDEVVEDYPLPVWHLAGDWAHHGKRPEFSVSCRPRALRSSCVAKPDRFIWQWLPASRHTLSRVTQNIRKR